MPAGIDSDGHGGRIDGFYDPFDRSVALVATLRTTTRTRQAHQWRLWSPRTPSSSCSRKCRPIANENPPRNATIRAALALPRTCADLWSCQTHLRLYSKFGGVSEQNEWRREAPVVMQSSLVTRRPARHPPARGRLPLHVLSTRIASAGAKRTRSLGTAAHRRRRR